MRILNVRVGFATNSSSSHSVLLLAGHGRTSDDEYSGDFGWENFTLATAGGKERYLVSQLAEALGYQPWGEHEEENAAAVRAVAAALGKSIGDEPDIGAVDHQSTWTFPRSWDDDGIVDADYVRDFAKFLRRPDVLVLGGNDNSDGHPLESANPGRAWRNNGPLESGGGLGFVARRDPLGYWTLFNRGTGMKVRVMFDEGDIPARAFAPELVDVKITDYCPFGCAFCYQDSTVEGKHASLEAVVDVAKRLAAARVFEVAIGGGEPTLHPDFAIILQAFRERGVVPNFTTRNLGWLRNRVLLNAVQEHAGGFAYSVQTAGEVLELARNLRASGWRQGHRWIGKGPTVAVHVVMGTVTRRSFEAILREVKRYEFGVTLLGWKRTGRADENPATPYLDWWLPAAKEHGPWRLGIDTALAAESEAAGVLADIPAWQYHTTDGPWSCYVDAVAGRIAPSSWQPERGSAPFDNRWLEAFQTYAD